MRPKSKDVRSRGPSASRAEPQPALLCFARLRSISGRMPASCHAWHLRQPSITKLSGSVTPPEKAHAAFRKFPRRFLPILRRSHRLTTQPIRSPKGSTTKPQGQREYRSSETDLRPQKLDRLAARDYQQGHLESRRTV